MVAIRQLTRQDCTMALPSDSDLSREIHYRRGAVMGLTVAEAFMLVAFILMMMLLFWRIAIHEEMKDRIDPDIERGFLRQNEDTRRKLRDLLRSPYLGEAIGVLEGLTKDDLEALRNGAKPVDSRRLKDLEAAEELAKRLKETGVSIEKIEALADTLRKHNIEEIEEALKMAEKDKGLHGRIKKRLSEEDRARRMLVDEIKRDLGNEIQAIGGRIDEFDGTITFPENALFQVGRYDIRPRFVETLNRVCPIWLEKLWKSTGQREIEEILIEGHSSSEWDSAPTERDAWILNLELSQRRAQAVLVHCLHLVEGKPSGEWSRDKLAAIGYSSSRPVLGKNRQESRQKSRRAVFRMRLSREQLRKEIQEELLKENPTSTPNGLRR